MDDWKAPFDQLAEVAETLNEGSSRMQGQLQAMAIALSALVRTHPDPPAFAQAFRRAWLAGDGFPQTDLTTGARRAGMESVVALLEVSCLAPLNVRPPGQAGPPER